MSKGSLSPMNLNRQTIDQLEDAARIAWRNSTRCIGRLFWRSLKVIDARDAKTADEVFDACVAHLRLSTNNGRIRPLITVFAAADERGIGPRIWNDQLIRYAGYRKPDGLVLGDPQQLAFTEQAIRLGWHPPAEPGRFDLLPLVVQMPGRSPQWFELPGDAVLEVPIRHPEFPWFSDLGLKWNALPALSRMALKTDGFTYTAAPFSGAYMGTEIGSRNLGDVGRYNLLPVIANRMGLDTSVNWSLWKDRALVELNAAVLFSFAQAGVTIFDHHSASQQFMDHVAMEESAGRTVPGDWSWLVPPMSASACPVFHREFEAVELMPNYVEQVGP